MTKNPHRFVRLVVPGALKCRGKVTRHNAFLGREALAFCGQGAIFAERWEAPWRGGRRSLDPHAPARPEKVVTCERPLCQSCGAVRASELDLELPA